jgi:hypothetical protein
MATTAPHRSFGRPARYGGQAPVGTRQQGAANGQSNQAVSGPHDGVAGRPAKGGVMVLLRHEIGDVLREQRQSQGRTLRQVSGAARVSLGYLSEVERGQKEASSELLASICGALELPLSEVLSQVSQRVATAERASASVASLPVVTGRSQAFVSAA